MSSILLYKREQEAQASKFDSFVALGSRTFQEQEQEQKWQNAKQEYEKQAQQAAERKQAQEADKQAQYFDSFPLFGGGCEYHMDYKK